MCLSSTGRAQPGLVVVWELPVMGVLNVNGAVRGKQGLTGCGGVLWDWNNCILDLFSGSIGIADSNETKLRAICQVLGILVEIDVGNHTNSNA
ncbi:hypothetical protein GQ457_18G021900 [Hibiscus cannabinus]